jgi:hypothetical protein
MARLPSRSIVVARRARAEQDQRGFDRGARFGGAAGATEIFRARGVSRARLRAAPTCRAADAIVEMAASLDASIVSPVR